MDESFKNLCIFHAYDGLREGLCHFSQQSRIALIYAFTPASPMRIYDPQGLLRGHEPKLKEIYLQPDGWQGRKPELGERACFYQIQYQENLQLAGLISYGGQAESIFYQMWFTEHHPDMCCIGPTERWLEHAVWLLSQDLASNNVLCIGSSRYVLQEYATHAVRDYIVDQRNLMMGLDTQLRVYPILDAVLGISKTLEEGVWPRGELIFVEPLTLSRMEFVACFPPEEQPRLKNFKHVRKLLQAVEHSPRRLISDGTSVVGIAQGKMPRFRITADFRGGYGFLKMDADLVCSFSDGRFHSTTRRARLVHVEEAILEAGLSPEQGNQFFKIISAIVHHCEERKYGCTLVIDFHHPPIRISGHHLKSPLDLSQPHLLDLAKSLAKVDGALHLGADLKLHGFACLLDGRAVPGEYRARGARFNSALRFTAEHQALMVVVVSSDRPVSVIQGGVELTARCEWKPLSAHVVSPPTLEEYIRGELVN